MYYTPGDADAMIVQKVAESATVTDTAALVGDDTDVLVLLRYHACLNSHAIFFKPK